MEYATRAQSVTSRYYGETEELLGYFAWYTNNSKQLPWPVGTKKPNDFWLFDMLGNCFTWCQESYNPDYPSGNGANAVDDKEDNLPIIVTSVRVLRGLACSSPAPQLRSALRHELMPTHRSPNNGFRPARTLSP